MHGTLSKLCAYQNASLMHADSLWHPPRFSRIQRVGLTQAKVSECIVYHGKGDVFKALWALYSPFSTSPVP